MLPDFRVRQRDYLLELARLLTQELDLDKLLARILRISVEMLAGQAGIIALKEADRWRVVEAKGIPVGTAYFAIKSWTAGDTMSELSNVVSVEVK